MLRGQEGWMQKRQWTSVLRKEKTRKRRGLELTPLPPRDLHALAPWTPDRLLRQRLLPPKLFTLTLKSSNLSGPLHRGSHGHHCSGDGVRVAGTRRKWQSCSPRVLRCGPANTVSQDQATGSQSPRLWTCEQRLCCQEGPFSSPKFKRERSAKNKRHQRSSRWMICIPAHVWQTLRWQPQGRVRRVLLAQLMRSKIRLTSCSSGGSAQSWSNGVINLSQPLNCAADSNSIS